MSPGTGLTSGFGGRPTLLTRADTDAPAALSAALSLFVLPSAVPDSLLTIAPLTWLGFEPGCCSIRSAAMLATSGELIEVPPMRKYPSSTMQLGHSESKSLFGAFTETMWAPGATTSGLAKPSCVTPRLDHGVSESSDVTFVPWSSTAPTVMTYGSLAGA